MNTKLSTKILENSPKIQQLESTKWIQVYDGTKKEFESDSKYDSILKDIPKDGLLIFKSNATVINPDGSTSGQWIFYYDGTKEQFEASPNSKEILENMPDFSLLICNDGNVLNPDGSINEDAIKEWVDSNFLKLTGGTLSGTLSLKTSDIDLENPSDTTKYTPDFIFRDKNNKIISGLHCLQYANGTRSAVLYIPNNLDDEEWYSQIAIVREKNNNTYATVNTPSETAPYNAIQTKESVTRDFLSKTGGEITGKINYKTKFENNIYPEEFAAHRLIEVQDKNNESLGYVQYGEYPDKKYIAMGLFPDNTQSNYTTIQICKYNDGTHGIEIPTYSTPDYSGKAVSFRNLQNYAPQKLISNIVSLYVDANTGSDTADLFNGRGLSKDKPFKSLNGCVNYIIDNCVNGNSNIKITLLSDVTMAAQNFYNHNLAIMTIQSESASSIRTITLQDVTSRFIVLSGVLQLQNINISAPNVNKVFDCMRHSFLTLLEGISINGSVNEAVILSYCGSVVNIHNSITGTVTGKRYACADNGCIITRSLGVNAIPGTIAGTCDSSSTYI